jgi:hypothetical protein
MAGVADDLSTCLSDRSRRVLSRVLLSFVDRESAEIASENNSHHIGKALEVRIDTEFVQQSLVDGSLIV